MPLLLLPLLIAVIAVLWVLLMPLALWQRYRSGRARRRLVPWLARLNAWALTLSAGVFTVSAWVAGYWMESALPHAVMGLGAGVAAGCLGLALTRFETDARGRFYTPNRWVILMLTLVVAARLAYGGWRAWHAWQADASAQWLAQQGSVLAVGGLLLGYYLAYTWGLRLRSRRP